MKSANKNKNKIETRWNKLKKKSKRRKRKSEKEFGRSFFVCFDLFLWFLKLLHSFFHVSENNFSPSFFSFLPFCFSLPLPIPSLPPPFSLPCTHIFFLLSLSSAIQHPPLSLIICYWRPFSLTKSSSLRHNSFLIR